MNFVIGITTKNEILQFVWNSECIFKIYKEYTKRISNNDYKEYTKRVANYDYRLEINNNILIYHQLQREKERKR